ncbi:MAG: microcystin degradation protein MlrC [Gammaproteobacteria bacterium]|jgi:microcystin degradation protein MlrC
MSSSRRIAIVGFQHETNTFAPYMAPFAEFVKADSWPGLTFGDDLFSVMPDLNIPLSGFMKAAQRDLHDLVPILWGSAEPCSFVTSDAYERISGMICDAISSTKDLDAVYLDLHGAMVTEDYEDGEGELLNRIRAIVGPDMPIMISLDLHANVTEAMVAQATAITVFRTYPHLDMAETGLRVYDLMEAAFSGQSIMGGMRKMPFLIPLTSQCTDLEPCKSIYNDLVDFGRSSVSNLSIDFATGFPASDIYECGPAIVAYGTSQDDLDVLIERCLTRILELEPQFVLPLFEPDEAVQRAMRNESSRPVVLADVQDNSGAGGTSDTTGLLESLVRNGAQKAAIGILHDPEIATMAHTAGPGASIKCALGGKTGTPDVTPYQGEFLVERITDGQFTLTGEMYKNSQARLGKMALLKIVDETADVRIVVGSERFQCLDLAIFRHLKIEPTTQSILAVKSTVHFRADFDSIASETLAVVAPGVNPCILTKLEYKRLRSDIRIEPNQTII